MSMRKLLRLSGIYDKISLEQFIAQDVNKWVFDLRPKSFNFIQQYVLEDCIKYLQGTGLKHVVFLQIQHEKDFMLQKLLNDLKSFTPENGNIELLLDLSESQDVDLALKFNIPFLWNYDFKDDYGFLKNELFKGILINHSMLQRLSSGQQLGSFVQDILLQKANGFLKDKEIALAFDWTDDLHVSVLDFIKFDFYSLPINAKVETSYRNVNHQLVGQNLVQIKRLLLSNSSSSRIST